jgi:hypothetical protein
MRTRRELPSPSTMRRPALGGRALAHVGEHQQQLVRGRHEPHVGLALVQVEGLDRQRLQHAVVHLPHHEAGELLVHAAVEAAQLGHRAAVVVEALELDDFEPSMRLPGAVVLLGSSAGLGGRR